MNYCKISLNELTGKEVKPGYRDSEFKKMFGSMKVNPELEFSRAKFFEESRKHINGMSISGVQQKLSMKEDSDHNIVATDTDGFYILKPSPEEYPNASENEHIAMKISQYIGIDTALCGLVSFNDGELSYITKRFDRTVNGNRVSQEDLLQCADLNSGNKYELSYEEAGLLVNKVTNGKKAVVLEFVRRVIYAYMIGNDDLHLKNISVQRLPDNNTLYYDKLTPNYDCLFIDAFNSAGEQNRGLSSLALSLLYDPKDGGEQFTDMYQLYGYYTGHDFIELGKRLDLPEKPIITFIKKLNTERLKILEIISRSYMPQDMKDNAKNKVKERIRVLQIIEPM